MYLSHFILKRGTQFIVSLRHRWRDIYIERELLAPYLLPGASECQCLHPLASRIFRDNTNASDWLHIPGLTLNSDWTDCLNLTTWFSYHMVSFWLHTCSAGLPRCTAIPLFTNHNVTACQSTRDHQEQAQNPCQQSLYNTGKMMWPMWDETGRFSVLWTPNKKAVFFNSPSFGGQGHGQTNNSVNVDREQLSHLKIQEDLVFIKQRICTTHLLTISTYFKGFKNWM